VLDNVSLSWTSNHNDGGADDSDTSSGSSGSSGSSSTITTNNNSHNNESIKSHTLSNVSFKINNGEMVGIVFEPV
jgi:ABC-type polysaccharide/polyol phosphate transport system ATPase subunit